MASTVHSHLSGNSVYPLYLLGNKHFAINKYGKLYQVIWNWVIRIRHCHVRTVVDSLYTFLLVYPSVDCMATHPSSKHPRVSISVTLKKTCAYKKNHPKATQEEIHALVL